MTGQAAAQQSAEVTSTAHPISELPGCGTELPPAGHWPVSAGACSSPRAAASAAEPDDEAAAGGERRAWEPPFDSSAPAPPMSYPITDLAALAYLSADANFHLPFNRASVPGPESALPARRRVLVCHDMEGGYRDDAAPQGGANPDAYALWHWHLVDVFVYFSHYLVTLPPPCWTNAAHLHGVKVCFS